MKRDLVMAYEIGQEYNSNVANVKHKAIIITLMRKVKPADALMTASEYSNEDLLMTKSIVETARIRGKKVWYESGYSSRESMMIKFQGQINLVDGNQEWYSARLDSTPNLQRDSISLINKVWNACDKANYDISGGELYRLTTPTQLLAGLAKLKAVKVEYVTINLPSGGTTSVYFEVE